MGAGRCGNFENKRKVMQVTAYETFVMLFYSLDAIYDESPNESLGNYLSGLNPFLFENIGSADPAEYDEFESEFSKVFPTGSAKPERAYEFCKKHLQKAAPIEAKKAFEEIVFEDWNGALKEM